MNALKFNGESMQVINDDGTVSDAQSIPFYQFSWLRLRWLPICIKHKLKFKSDGDYNDHWTTVCEHYDYRECPPSDHLYKLRGYSWWKGSDQ